MNTERRNQIVTKKENENGKRDREKRTESTKGGTINSWTRTA